MGATLLALAIILEGGPLLRLQPFERGGTAPGACPGGRAMTSKRLAPGRCTPIRNCRVWEDVDPFFRITRDGRGDAGGGSDVDPALTAVFASDGGSRKMVRERHRLMTDVAGAGKHDSLSSNELFH
jgi:hypothetical protein